MIRILVADDHTIVRKGLKEILADTSDMVVTGEAASGQEVLDKVSKNDYDVILLDITMPGRSGLDILRELKTQRPELNILVLSMHPEEQYAVRVLRAGASGYLTKESAPEELIVAIRKVAAGGRYVTSSLAEKLAFDVAIGAEKAPHQTLSDREFQVMCMIASGKTGKQIAAELMLGVKTISTYRQRALAKMNMKSNVELTRYVIENRLLG